MTRVVFDTNVLVSAALRDRDPEHVMLAVMSRRDWEWVATAAVKNEYVRVLSSPRLSIPADVVERWTRWFGRFIVPVVPTVAVRLARDRSDEHLLICAASARADYLVTGDRDFEDAQPLVRTRIVTVAAFKRILSEIA